MKPKNTAEPNDRSNRAEQSQRAIHLHAHYPHPPERVWHALTDPKALGRWLLPTTFQPCLGSRFTFLHKADNGKPGNGKRRRVHCQVVELAAPHRLAYTWQAEDEDIPTLVTWTLEPTDAGTRVTLEHIGPASPLAGAQGGMKMLSSALRQNVSSCALLPAPRRRLGRIIVPASPLSLHCVSHRRVRPASGVVAYSIPRCRHTRHADHYEKV